MQDAEPSPEREQSHDHEPERRLVLRVLQRWEELRGTRTLPPRDEIDEAAMGDDWPCCLVLDLDIGSASEGAPYFTHVGAALEAADWNSPGRRLSDCPEGTLLKMATAFFPRVLDKRIPISIGASGQHLGRAILFRAILLPLSNDGERIDALLGAANFREAGGAGSERRP